MKDTSGNGAEHKSALVWKGDIGKKWAQIDELLLICIETLAGTETYFNGKYIGRVDTLEQAKQAAKGALCEHLKSERDRFDQLLRELNGEPQ